MGTADFCRNVPVNLRTMLPPGTTQDVVNYYMTCSPLSSNNANFPFRSLQSITLNDPSLFNRLYTSQFNLIQTNVKNLLGGSCANDTNLLTASQEISNIQNNIEIVLTNTQCSPVQKELFIVFNKGVCGNTLTGLYAIIITYFVITTSLFFVMTTSSVLWQYFPLKFWSSQASYYGEEIQSPLVPPTAPPRRAVV